MFEILFILGDTLCIISHHPNLHQASTAVIWHRILKSECILRLHCNTSHVNFCFLITDDQADSSFPVCQGRWGDFGFPTTEDCMMGADEL